MRATGIIRRIDDLGRVVIPKEIRRTCGIREGDPFEIFIETSDGMPMVCFRKYETSHLRDIASMADRIDEEMMESGYMANRAEVRKHFAEIAKLVKEWEES